MTESDAKLVYFTSKELVSFFYFSAPKTNHGGIFFSVFLLCQMKRQKQKSNSQVNKCHCQPTALHYCLLHVFTFAAFNKWRPNVTSRKLLWNCSDWRDLSFFFSIRLQWTQTLCLKTSKLANGYASDIDEDCTDRRAKGQIQNEHHFKRVLREKFSQKIQSQSVSTQTRADGKLRGPRNFPTTSPSAGRWVDSRQIWFYFGWTCVFFTVALHNRKNPVTGQLWPHSATSFPGAFVADAVCNSYAESGRLLATNSKWICGPRSVHIGNQSAAKKKKKQKTLKCFLDSVTQI